MSNKRHMFKILFAGECGVGKSSLVSRYLDNQYDDSRYTKTIGVEFFTKMIKMDEESFTLYIWDTSGDKVFRELIKKCYDFSDIVYIIFDISQRISFINANNWIQSIRSKLGEKTNIVLVGNKCDLNREISKEEAENFALDQKIHYIETSAKNGFCVKEMFSIFIDQIFNKKSEDSNPVENESKQQNSNCIIE